MANYDFSTLNPLDFEELTCDLLNSYYCNDQSSGTFRSFKPGRDKGIDLLLSTPENDYEIIGQVKHYVKSTYSKLKYDLKNIEKNKISQLNPKSYIVITSQELSNQNKIEIKKIFEPFIRSLDDIFGREDLNRLLRENQSIEEKHYKLWFSSSTILNKIVAYKFEGRKKEFTDVVLKRRIRLFVITRDFHLSKFILKENNFIILTGEPGVGKSTLSDMLIYDYIKEDFQLNIIYDDIKEVEIKLLDDNSKQIFYFDDFLGHTQAEIHKSKSAENSLLRIISRIENLENKYLILNTRKFILTSFLQESERFREFNPLRSEAKIELKSYPYGIKRRMLDNHIFESNLNEDQLEVISKLAPIICGHKNFTPRIVDFFTGSKVINYTKKKYKDFILSNLEYPKEIWLHAYSCQITEYEIFLLNTLFSLNGEVVKSKLEVAYNERLDFEVRFNNFKKPLNSFNDSLRRINNGFIVASNYKPIFIGFINPSLEDFLKFYILPNELEVDRILLSSKFIEQWYYFYKPFISLKECFNNKLSNHFIENSDKLISNKKDYENIFLILIFAYFFIDISSSKKLVSNLLLKINDWKFLKGNSSTHFYSKKFLDRAKSDSSLSNIIINFENDFFFYSLMNEEGLDGFLELAKLFLRHLNFNFIECFRNKEDEEYVFIISLYEHLTILFSGEVEDQDRFLRLFNTEEDLHQEIIIKFEEYHDFIVKNMFDVFDVSYEILKIVDWNSRAQINLTEKLNNLESKSDNIEDYEHYADEVFSDYEYDYLEYYEDEHAILDKLISAKSVKKYKDMDEFPF
jgi:Novel STAND NTPase 3